MRTLEFFQILLCWVKSMRPFQLTLPFASLAGSLAFSFSVAAAPAVVSFSPLGLAKQVQQVTARFSEPLTGFGSKEASGPNALEPFQILCAVSGQGRWVTPSTWQYDFSEQLPSGLSCSFSLKPGLKSLQKELVSDHAPFVFNTGGPAIVASQPYEGARIDTDQIFALALDGAVNEKTVLPHVSFSVEGIGESIAARLVPLSELQPILSHHWDLKKASSKGQLIALAATRVLPANAKVQLNWNSGIASPMGIATTESQKMQFQVREEFNAHLTCERENAKEGCLPIAPVTLVFSSSVPWPQLEKMRLRNSQTHAEIAKPFVDVPRHPQETRTSVEFKIPLEPKTKYEITVPHSLQDEDSRPLANPHTFPLVFETGSVPVLAKFAANFGIIELQDPVLPLTVRNIEGEIELQQHLYTPAEIAANPGKALAWINRVNSHSREKSIWSSDLSFVPERTKISKKSLNTATEIVGVPLKGPGLHVLQLESKLAGKALLGSSAPLYVPTLALVTDLAAHLKFNNSKAWVWVTRLSAGAPESSVDVTLVDCKGRKKAQGKTDASGMVMLVQSDSSSKSEYNRYSTPCFAAVASKNNDTTFSLSSWNEGLESWRFPSLRRDYSAQNPSVRYAAVLDRTLLRAGETLHIKHHVVNLSSQKLSPSEYPLKAFIVHAATDERSPISLKWKANGTAESAYQIPNSAKGGYYQVEYEFKKSARGHSSGTSVANFRVDEFKLPTMRARLQPSQSRENQWVDVSSVGFDFALEYLSGGTPSEAKFKIKSQATPWPDYSFPQHPNYSFASERPKEGITQPYLENSGEPQDESESQPSQARSEKNIKTQDGKLSKNGTAQVAVEALAKQKVVQNVSVSLEYSDANGEIQTATSSAQIFPASSLVGLKSGQWDGKKNEVALSGIVVDVKQKTVARVPYSIVAYQSLTYSHRKRLLGGFYAYETLREIKKIKEVCSGVSSAQGTFECVIKPPARGEVQFLATISDDHGRTTYASTTTYISGERTWFGGDDSDRIDVIADKEKYLPGQTAHLQVRAPFENATALLSLERDGLLEWKVVPLSGKNPVIDVPITAAMVPNLFASVMVTRGRIGTPPPGALVDLAKPSFKMGYTELKVETAEQRLQVTVTTPKNDFQVRESVSAHVSVKTYNGAPLPAGSEAVFLAVDKALLEMAPNPTWNLLEQVFEPFGHRVTTSTGLVQVVGRRHFGLKAQPAGGGGGRMFSRELFDTLVTWKGAVKLTEQGQAEINFKLNDSLSEFELVAIVRTPLNQFGTGQKTIRTTQDVMVLSGAPDFLHAGDILEIPYTLRNTSKVSKNLDLQFKSIQKFQSEQSELLPPRSVSLAAGSEQRVTFPLKISELQSLSHSAILELAILENNVVVDKIRTSIPVHGVTRERTVEALLGRVAPEARVPLAAFSQRPDANLEVELNSKLGGSLGGIDHYMRNYPFSCLEQRTSKALVLQDKKAWKGVLKDLPHFLDSDGLAKFFSLEKHGHVSLTAYLLSIANASSWEISERERERMLAGLDSFLRSGKGDFATRVEALEAIVRYQKPPQGMLDSWDSSPELWPTGTLVQAFSVLSRIPASEQQKTFYKKVETQLLARLTQFGSFLTLRESTTQPSYGAFSNIDAAVPQLLAVLFEKNLWPDQNSLLFAGALAQHKKGHFGNTVANAWASVAARIQSSAQESIPVGGFTKVSVGANSQEAEWGKRSKITLNFKFEKPSDKPSSATELNLVHTGTGAPWFIAQARVNEKVTEPEFHGLELSRKIEPVEQKSKGVWSTGDVALVTLKLTSKIAQNWVVVEDPLPSGAQLEFETFQDYLDDMREPWLAFRERKQGMVRFYYESIWPGSFETKYRVRVNVPGQFNLPPSHAEAMYAPEMSATLPVAQWSVQQ